MYDLFKSKEPTAYMYAIATITKDSSELINPLKQLVNDAKFTNYLNLFEYIFNMLNYKNIPDFLMNVNLPNIINYIKKLKNYYIN